MNVTDEHILRAARAQGWKPTEAFTGIELVVLVRNLSALSNERLRKDAELGERLWQYLVKHRVPWSESDIMHDLVEMGLLTEVDMGDEEESERCADCDGDCGTCYRVTDGLFSSVKQLDNERPPKTTSGPTP